MPAKKKAKRTPEKKPAPKAAPPAAKKPARAPKKSAPSAGGDLSAQILSDLPRLTDAEREVFRAQFDDVQCDELGARTKGDAVRVDALAWSPIIHKALKSHPNALRRYGATRFAWLMECVRRLEGAIAEQKAERTRGSETSMDLDLARIAAMSVRNDLHDTLSLLCGTDAGDKHALTLALSRDPAHDHDRVLADSLDALADLAGEWLARDDARAKTLIASVSLGASDVEAARSAAQALREVAITDALGPVSTGARDAPTVNRAEGRVLLEMRVAQQVFARAHDANREVPKLTPGAGTKHVLGGHPKKKAGTPPTPATDPSAKPTAPAS